MYKLNKSTPTEKSMKLCVTFEKIEGPHISEIRNRNFECGTSQDSRSVSIVNNNLNLYQGSTGNPIPM